MMGLDNPLHIAFLLIVALMVFGAKRLPEMGRSLGAGMRGFKDAINPDLTPQPVIAQAPAVQPDLTPQPAIAQAPAVQPQHASEDVPERLAA